MSRIKLNRQFLKKIFSSTIIQGIFKFFLNLLNVALLRKNNNFYQCFELQKCTDLINHIMTQQQIISLCHEVFGRYPNSLMACSPQP